MHVGDSRPATEASLPLIVRETPRMRGRMGAWERGGTEFCASAEPASRLPSRRCDTRGDPQRMTLRAPSTPLRPDRRKEVLSECAPLKMPPVHKGLPETAAGLRNAVAYTGRQRRREPPFSLQPATRSPVGVPCAHSWCCPVAHCEPADRHDREHAARKKPGLPGCSPIPTQPIRGNAFSQIVSFDRIAFL